MVNESQRRAWLADGDVYIMPDGKTGTNWGAMTNLALAYHRDGVLEEITPRTGFRAYVKHTGASVTYDGAAWAPAGGCFSVHMHGTTQTRIVSNAATKLTRSTEVFDVGGRFASDKWTPPAGKVRLSWGVQMQALSTYGLAVLYKNGARSRMAPSAGRPAACSARLGLSSITPTGPAIAKSM